MTGTDEQQVARLLKDDRGQVGPDPTVWIPGQILGFVAGGFVMIGLVKIGSPEGVAAIAGVAVLFIVGQLAWAILHEIKNGSENNA